MTKTYWRATLVFALATSLMSAYLLPLFPATSHIDVSGYGSPVFAFEMAENITDIENIFGPETDPKRAERIAQMDEGNRWDFAFMWLYSFFLCLFVISIYKSTNNKLWLVPAVLGFASGGFDAIENIMLLELTKNFNSPQLLNLLWLPVYAKFTAIALASCAGAYYIFKQPQIAWKVIGVIAICASLASFMALISPSEYGWLLQHTVTFSWVPMLAYALYRSVFA